MYYLINQTLTPTTLEACLNATTPYVILLSYEQWQNLKGHFQIHMDLDFHTKHFTSTKAEVNAEAVTGSFVIPNRQFPSENVQEKFAFVLNERGIIFVGDSPLLLQEVQSIEAHKRWKIPSLERFLYDFVESLIHDDNEILEGYDMALSQLEDELLSDSSVEHIHQLNSLRRDFLILNRYYDQLADLTQELYENENDIFKEENLRYFHLLNARLGRLDSSLKTLREYVVQIRELYNSQMDARQNKLMNTLTIVTTCCLPLNILVGWYGMNFKYMPELAQKWAYPAVIFFAISIFSTAIYYFKKKKWL